MALPICATLMLLGFWIVHGFEERFNPPPYYTEFRDSLRVLEYRMNWVEKDKQPLIYVTGILTNQGPVAWKEVEFECRFYDTNGLMVDVYNAHGYFTIFPNDDRAFRVSVSPLRPSQDYVSLKLSVSTARNIKGWL